MIGEDENETVVIEDLRPGTTQHPGHIHHNREVICKKGLSEVTIGPLSKPRDDDRPHYAEAHRYVRTEAKDELGRAIFRLALAG